MSNMGCAEVREVAPEFALGILDGEQRSDVLLHLDHCAACRRQVGELSETADSLVLLAPEAEPPPGFERRVLGAMDDSVRRRRWRTIKLVAATAAAAAIFSVATVRIIDQTRDGTVSSSPTAATVAMVGDDGNRVGRVDVVDSGTTMSFDVSVDYSLPDGSYRVVLDPQTGASQGLGTIQVVGGKGTWSGAAPVQGSTDLTLVDEAGKERCSAELPPS